MFILHPLFKYKIYLFVKEKVRSAALLTHQEKVLAPGIVGNLQFLYQNPGLPEIENLKLDSKRGDIIW